MTEEEAMLVTIRANPDDDLPRLVYADWIQEHGDEERAVYIRVQCELAKVPGYPSGWDDSKYPEAAALHRRMVELGGPRRSAGEWSENQWRWFASRLCWAEGFITWRGFVRSIRCSVQSWLVNGDAVCRADPIQVVTLTDVMADRLRDEFLKMDDVQGYARAGEQSVGAMWKSLHGNRWPGVEFEFLSPPPLPANLQAMSRRFRAGLALSLSPTTPPPPDAPAE